MEFKREILIAFFIASSLFCAQLYAQRYNLSVVKTTEPVKTITWDDEGTNFAYAERNNIVIRNVNGNTLVQQIPTYKSDINILQFSNDGSDQLASLHSDGLLDFRYLPQSEPAITVETDDSNPTIISYSDDGTYFAVGNEHGTVFLYTQSNPADAQQIGNLGVPITALCFSRDNKYLVIGAADNSVSLMELASRKIVGGYAYNAKNKVPILMSADSKSIIMTTGDSTVGFFDLQFNRYNYYTTYRDILSMHISADNRFLIILTDDNVFSYYDMQTHELKKYIPSFNETKILAYSFNSSCSKLAVSHEDGSLYVLDVASVILDMEQQRTDFTTSETAENESTFDFSNSNVKTPEPAPVEEKKEEKPVTPKKTVTPEPAPKPAEPEPKPAPVTPAPEPAAKPAAPEKAAQPVVTTPAKKETKKEEKKKETPKETTKEETPKKESVSPLKNIFAEKFNMDAEEQRQKFKDGQGLLVNLGFATIRNDKYTFGAYLPVGYRNYDLLQPFYFGGTLEPFLYFPVYDFPYEYKINGVYAGTPRLTGIRMYVPFGFALYPLKNSFEVYAEIDTGMSLNNAWNLRFGDNFVASKIRPAFLCAMRIGVAWDFINLSICGAYDSILKAYFCGELGVCINLGGSRDVGGSRLK